MDRIKARAAHFRERITDILHEAAEEGISLTVTPHDKVDPCQRKESITSSGYKSLQTAFHFDNVMFLTRQGDLMTSGEAEVGSFYIVVSNGVAGEEAIWLGDAVPPLPMSEVVVAHDDYDPSKYAEEIRNIILTANKHGVAINLMMKDPLERHTEELAENKALAIITETYGVGKMWNVVCAFPELTVPNVSTPYARICAKAMDFEGADGKMRWVGHQNLKLIQPK